MQAVGTDNKLGMKKKGGKQKKKRKTKFFWDVLLVEKP